MDFSLADKGFGKYVWVLYIALGLGVLYLVYWIVHNVIGNFGSGLGKTASNIGTGAVSAAASTLKEITHQGREYVDNLTQETGVDTYLTSPKADYTATADIAYAKARSDFAKSYGITIDRVGEYGFPSKSSWLFQNGY